MRWLILVAVVPLWQPLRPAWGPRYAPRAPVVQPVWPGVRYPVPVWVVPRGRGIPEDPWGRPLVPDVGRRWGWEDMD